MPPFAPFRRTKVICTLGPASRTPEVIGQLIEEGMDVARLNFSHGTADDHRRAAALVREQARRHGRPVAILQDLQGPKIRVGRMAPGTELIAGTEFVLTTEEVLGDARRASTTYKELPRDVRPGDVLLLDDGLLQIAVQAVLGDEIITRVQVGGRLSDHKGINLPGVKISAPSLSQKDRADLAVGQELGVDFVALSFVRSPADVLQAREAIGRAGPQALETPIIAKIEKPEAVERLEEILEAADGIMIARGDLGVELGAEKVPLLQKSAIERANAQGKLVITATQMLESMTGSPRPTRAEASDVANAILDGTDAVMLSAETAVGRYPLQAVRTMVRIIREVEGSPRFHQHVARQKSPATPSTSNAVAHAAAVAARLCQAPVIAAISDSGGVVRLLSEYRSEALVLGLTRHEEVWRRLAAYWGVVPLLAPDAAAPEELTAHILQLVREQGYGRPGQVVVITMALPLYSGQATNTLRLHSL